MAVVRVLVAAGAAASAGAATIVWMAPGGRWIRNAAPACAWVEAAADCRGLLLCYTAVGLRWWPGRNVGGGGDAPPLRVVAMVVAVLLLVVGGGGCMLLVTESAVAGW